MHQLPLLFKKCGDSPAREEIFNSIEELTTQFSNLHIIHQLPFFFKDYVDYNAREEIFNAIKELASSFRGFIIQQLAYSIYHHYQYSSRGKLSETNITEREIKVVTNYFPEAITKMRIDLDVNDHPMYLDRPKMYRMFSEEIRMVLSGMALFRIEILPIFLNTITNESDKVNLSQAPLFVYAHEEKLKGELLCFIHEGKNLGQEEERRKKYPPSHLWWNAKQFAKMKECVDVVAEYMLED